MLTEWFTHLRGYDKWTQAIATVRSATLSRVGKVGNDSAKPEVALGWESVCEIRWHDQNHVEHSATFRAFEESPLYQLCEGDTVDIRFNPTNPSEYYLPGLFQSDVVRTWKLTVWTVLMVVLSAAFILFLLAH